eukprot:714626-Amphidinium_carterae.1
MGIVRQALLLARNKFPQACGLSRYLGVGAATAPPLTAPWLQGVRLLLCRVLEVPTAAADATHPHSTWRYEL